MIVAVLTVVMLTTLDPVLFQPSPSAEVEPTLATYIVKVRVGLVLVYGIGAVEPSLAALTEEVGHRVGIGGKVRRELNSNLSLVKRTE